MPTPDGFRVTQQVPGGQPVDLTQDETSATWTSTIPGGFGDATITIPRLMTQKERGLLGGITLEYEGRVLFEGRVEDAKFSGSKTGLATQLQAFGLQRLLSDNSVRRIWSLRSGLNPNTVNAVAGSSTAGVMFLRQDNFRYAFGRYKPTDPSKFGFRLAAVVGLNNLDTGQVSIVLPAGLTGVRLMCDLVAFDNTGLGAWRALVHSTADGVTYTSHLEQTATGVTVAVNVALVAGAREIRFSGSAVGSGVGATTDGSSPYVEISNIRIIGSALNEDQAGGFYGGTILRDAISFAPGIYPGTIESGSDFAIAEMSRITRSSILDVVQQVDALYAREWGVWEGGRFDWITPDLKSGGWVIPLGALSAWEIEQSIDSVARRVYVPFTDAADNLQKEASADATSARNPYVRLGLTKDVVVGAPASMTSVTAPLLAAKLVNDLGRWPDIKGSATLLAGQLVKSASGSQTVPAFAIRAGDNITIPDLPVEDIYAAGQDGATVFHVTGVSAGTDGNVVLTLEGLTRRIDVLMARLGAVSQ